MKNKTENQPLDANDLDNLEKEIRNIELDKLILEKNISIKQESGYFEAVSFNAAADHWRKTFVTDYRKKRRQQREAEAKEEGRTLRAYEPATKERRSAQLRAAKAKARLDPVYAQAERAKNTATRSSKRKAMTPEERDEANRIRREKRTRKATEGST